ncbi:MAG: stage 0 sporulation protein [Clostridiales bacterium]|nr:stage 0 sporulation protein [Clostridiales bacterium]
MKTVIGVRFKEGGKMYYFDPGEFDVKEGDGVIVETSRGTEFGDVVAAPQELEDDKIIAPLKSVVRIATPYDREQRDKNRAKESEAYEVCMEKIAAHNLDMKLVDVEYTFNGSKVVFYFTADGRVDFRELVKDLAGVFKTRIELRQIGVRDEAKMLGGLGSCGRPVCCKQFLADFTPVSIKMAKEQNLSLSPTKISGICGRLMCCLKYEQDAYESMRKQMPRTGREVITPDGVGTVVENNVITERTRVRVALSDGTFDVRDYPFRELQVKNGPARQAREEFPEEPDDTIEDEALLALSDENDGAEGEAAKPRDKKRRRSNTKEQHKKEQGEQKEPREHREPKKKKEQPESTGEQPADGEENREEGHGDETRPSSGRRRGSRGGRRRHKAHRNPEDGAGAQPAAPAGPQE